MRPLCLDDVDSGGGGNDEVGVGVGDATVASDLVHIRWFGWCGFVSWVVSRERWG